LKQILRLIKKDYILFWGDKLVVSLTFIIPIILIAIWGAIFGNIDSGVAGLYLAFVNNSSSPVTSKIERVLDTTKAFILIKKYTDEKGNRVLFDTNTVKDFVRKGKSSAALVIPADAYTDTSLGIKLRFYYDPKNGMEMQMIQGMLQRTIMSQIPGIFMQSLQRQAMRTLGVDSGKAFNSEIALTVSKYYKIDPKLVLGSYPIDSNLPPEAEKNRNIFGNILQLEQIQLVGADISNPWATRSVGGWAIMFLMFTLTASSSSLFEEKKSGVVLRILVSPISRVHILWSKYLYNISLGFIQLTVLFVAGSLMYRIDIFSNFVNLLLVILAAASACTAFGMLLSAFSKTAAQANGWGTFLILAMSSIGGAWFPTSFMPGYIQTISKFTIVYWSMDGFLQVLWRQAGIESILPTLGILFGVAIVISSISVLQFKKGEVF